MLLPTLWPVLHRAHMSAVLCSRYTGFWLPIGSASNCVLMHGVHNGTSHSYLMDTTTQISPLPGHRQLHSVMTTEYDIPRTKTKFWDSFLCCWTARVECSFRRYKEHYRLIILQTSHQDTLFYIGIFELNSFSRLYYVRRFWTIFRGV